MGEDGKHTLKLLCGLLSGSTSALLFNPYDRALYLSVKNKRPFLRKDNFVRPFQGVSQSVAHRALSGGLWWPLEDFCQSYSQSILGPGPTAKFAAGSLAGVLNGCVNNPISAVRYQCWGEVHPNLAATAHRMWRGNGIGGFTKGTAPTVLRDAIFGATFSGTRKTLREDWPMMSGFLVDFVSAACATVLSGPANYARNMIYACPPGTIAPTAMQACWALHAETLAHKGLATRLSVVQQRLRVGWGTVRVAVGMAVGAQMYTSMCTFMGCGEPEQ